MEYRPINEEIVKDVLRNRDEKIRTIHEKMANLYQEAGKDAVLQNIALPAQNLTGMPGAKGNHKDLSDVLLAYQKQYARRNAELREVLWELSDEEEQIYRIWGCFNALDNPFYSILDRLYVKGEKYQSVEQEMGICHNTFENNRAQAVKLIMMHYESELSIAEIIRRDRSRRKINKKGKGRKKEQGMQQMSISDFI